MSMKRYRFDRTGEAEPNGSVPVFSDWHGGPTLAGVHNCPCPDGKRRTVYVLGEADTYFTVPAAISIRDRRIKGFLTHDDTPDGYVFNSKAMVTVMSWKPEVIADNSGKWVGNAQRYATKAEAEGYVQDLAARWSMVRDTRAVESTDPVNAVWDLAKPARTPIPRAPEDGGLRVETFDPADLGKLLGQRHGKEGNDGKGPP